jgi:glucose/arabinose dehydrogenase
MFSLPSRLPLTVLAVLLVASVAGAATLPAGFTETRLATGLSAPTAMAFSPDGRLFVCEQGGRLRIVKNGQLLATPFVTVSVNSAGERGLLGVAFDPNFATEPFVYVYHTTSTSPVHNRIVRFRASASNPDVAESATGTVIFTLPNLSSATNHNGGAIHFLGDKLFVAVGENANGSLAQSLNTTLGKVLRINRDGSIPTDNPFFNQTTGNNRAIWALGLRNPFTFAIQPGGARLHVNDVGQNTWEEVNHLLPGRNFGWPNCEGPHNNSAGTCPNPPAGFTAPVFAYQQGTANCAIVGGSFYNPATLVFPSEFTGRYFYGDLCGGFIRFLSPPNYTASGNFATGINQIVDLAVGQDGNLYYLTRGGGEVFRVTFNNNQAPQITQQPQSRTVAVGQSVTFTVAASGAAPLSFQWQRNGANIAGATSSSFTIASVAASDNGATFRAVVTNAFGTATSNSATLTVTNNQPPTATINTPAAGTTFRGGQLVNFSGSASDPQDGTLPASAFTWRVDLHHEAHVHPFVQPTTGITSGSFTTSDRGHPETTTFYRITLTVRDSGGLTTTVTRDLAPLTSTITLATQPTGLTVTLDGQPMTAPVSQGSVEGVFRTIGVVTPQTVGGITWEFVSWSDGGAATHDVATPTADTTFTATFRQVTGGSTLFSDDFNANLGWVTNPTSTDTATTGAWQRGDPQGTTSGTSAMQLNNCNSGTMCLGTGLTAGASVGANDIDGGVTSIQSPTINIPATGTATLTFAFYMAHLNNATTADFLRVRVVGTANTIVFEELGAANTDVAAWATTSVSLAAFRGQTVRIRIEAADAATGSLIEAAVDDVRVTHQP